MQEEERRALQALKLRGQPVPLDEAQRRAWQERFNQVPAMLDFALRIDLADSHVVRVELAELEDRHRRGDGAVLAAMFDCALGVAGGLQFPGRRGRPR